MDLPSTSNNLDAALYGCEAARTEDTRECASEPSGWLMSDTDHAVDTWHSPPANRTCALSSSGHFHEVKVDKTDGDAQFSLLKRDNGETCSPSSMEKQAAVDPCTPPRSQSPDIYSDDEPAGKCHATYWSSDMFRLCRFGEQVVLFRFWSG